MEFLRLGSSIPGSYWGCCAVCVIQNFQHDPSSKAGIQLVSGDNGTALLHKTKDQPLFAGPTYEDIFWQRLRIGTFSQAEMPNHAFLAVLTGHQLNSATGKKWLKILAEAGFEFIRTIQNSVYTGNSVADEEELAKSSQGGRPNYLFGLFRNIGGGFTSDPFTPPKEWLDLNPVESCTRVLSKEEATQHRLDQLKVWKDHEPKPLLTEEELGLEDREIHLAGVRSLYPQQPKTTRKIIEGADKNKTQAKKSAFPTPSKKGIE